MRVSTTACFLAAALASCSTEPRGANILGPDGGRIDVPGATLEVPRGALGSDVEIVVEPIEPPAGYRAAGGRAYRFSPRGLEFAVPARVHFDVGSGDGDAEVFWTVRGDTRFERLATTPTDAGVTALVTHFSDGFAGWAELVVDGAVPADGAVEAGPVDGGSATTADATAVDAETDASVTGVTCEVTYGEGAECTQRVEVYENVTFYFERLDGSVVGHIWSDLYGFEALYLGDSVFPGDPEGVGYVVGGDDVVGITRSGLRLDVDISTGRTGSCFDLSRYRIRVQCHGSTTIAAPAPHSCWPVEMLAYTPAAFEQPPLSCSVTRRDAGCVAGVSNETPTVRLGPGAHGPETRMYLDSPALRELYGGEMVLYQDFPCETYSPRVTEGSTDQRFMRRGRELATASESGVHFANATTCTDAVGRHPTLQVRCSGVVTAP